MRAGAQALSVLSVPLHANVLRALSEGPRSLIDLRRVVGAPPETTMRGHLKVLAELGVLKRHRRNEFPGSVDCELTKSGRDLLTVAAVLERWLAGAPEGPVSLTDPAAKSSIKALIDGWNSTIIRALATRSLSLTQLNRLISAHNYPSLERRLGAMRLAGLIEAVAGEGRGRPYSVAPWLRCAVGPLVAAARWESKHLAERTTPAGRLEVESYFLLATPLLQLSATLTGVCRLVAELRNSKGRNELVGSLIEIEAGEVSSCSSRIEGDADAWAVGSVSTWLRALVGEDAHRLELGGDHTLATAVVDGLHGVLFRVGQGA